MRISQQLFVLTICAITVIFAVAGSAFYCVVLLDESHKAVSKVASTLEDTQELCYHIANAAGMQKAYLITARADSKEQYENEVRITKRMLTQMRQQIEENSEEQQLFEKFVKHATDRLDSLDGTVKTYEIKGQEAAFERIRQGGGLTLMVQTIEASNDLTAYEHKRLDELKHLVNIHAKNTELAIVLGSIIAVGMIAVSNFLFSKNLSNAVTNLLCASKNAARERFELLVDIRSNNELGDLGRAFNMLAGNLRQKSEELDSAASSISITKTDLDSSLKQFDLLSLRINELCNYVNESAQRLQLSGEHQKRLEKELKELISLSDMLGVSLHQIFEFSRDIRVSAEILDKRYESFADELGQFSERSKQVTEAMRTLCNVLPETKDLITQLETLNGEFSALEVISSISVARDSGKSDFEIAVIKDHLKTLRHKLSSIRSNLTVNVSRIQQIVKDSMDAVSGFNGIFKGNSRPLESLSNHTKKLLHDTLNSRGELANLDRLHKRQSSSLDELAKRFILLANTITEDKDFADKVKLKMLSLPINQRRQITSYVDSDVSSVDSP